MTHNCTGDETCARCEREIDRIENDGGTYRPSRGVSLRKPLKPMPYQRLAELTAQTRAAAARLTDELDRRRTS